MSSVAPGAGVSFSQRLIDFLDAIESVSYTHLTLPTILRV